MAQRILKYESMKTVADANSVPHVNINWHAFGITVRKYITCAEVIETINSIIGLCETDDGFMPHLLDFAFKIGIIVAYTCVEFPDDVEEQHYIIYNTDLYDVVSKQINASQLEEIKYGVERCVCLFTS